MTDLIYLKDSYQKTLSTKVVSVKLAGNQTRVVLAETIFYPQGGGQPADQGVITGKKGKLLVTYTRMQGKDVVHEGKLQGILAKGDQVTAKIDWQKRYFNMRCHSAGHVLHEIIKQLIPSLTPDRADHGKTPFIQYQGMINPKLKETLEKQSNMMIAEERNIKAEFISLAELKKRITWIPPKLPANKPLRIIQIEGFVPMADGGTQVKNTGEIDQVKVTHIENFADQSQVFYTISELKKPNQVISSQKSQNSTSTDLISLGAFRSLILELQNQILDRINQTAANDLETLKVSYFGSKGEATQLIKKLKDLPKTQRKDAGLLVNEFKASINAALANKQTIPIKSAEWFDTSLPGLKPAQGHLHVVTQAIMEITRIFARLGFTRVRHPEVDWDWYAFTSLNMPPDHPARDEWETFFIDYPNYVCHSRGPSTSGLRLSSAERPRDGERQSNQSGNLSNKLNKIPGQSRNDKINSKFNKIVLTPHTSNGQVREMEKGKLPIRMINIAKCYRRQLDLSHTPMFHQFEGLYIDKDVSIGHLKGVFNFFVKQFFGPNREIRLRPFHFQFTEPSFEVDINCGICLGKACLANGQSCRLCKSGWLEMAGAGMVHPTVLKNGGIDPDKYSGFAFGWGVERAFMMKSGVQIDDIRLIYGNDIRFLEQF